MLRVLGVGCKQVCTSFNQSHQAGVCMYVMYVCMTGMYVCMYVFLYVCRYVGMYVCIFICM